MAAGLCAHCLRCLFYKPADLCPALWTLKAIFRCQLTVLDSVGGAGRAMVSDSFQKVVGSLFIT